MEKPIVTRDDMQRRIEFLMKIARNKRYRPEDFPEGSNTRAVLTAMQERDAANFERVVNGRLASPDSQPRRED
jgi:hypothetical protein